MMRKPVLLWVCCLLAACATTRVPPVPASGRAAWDQRASDLQKASVWQADGRAAVAYGSQGWQASLNWRQGGDASEVRLAGPFGVGALVVKRTPQGLSLNGAPPSDAVLAQLQQRLGFELPLDHLRYWLLGVPDPAAAFELTRNDTDRALKLIQDDWTVDYDKYLSVEGDVLPARLVMTREGARLRIVIDHWLLER